MNESSEVKALVRSANNLSGRSIKRKLQRRKAPPLQHLGDIYGCRVYAPWTKTDTNKEEMTICTYWIHRRRDCDMIGKSRYQSWEGLMVS